MRHDRAVNARTPTPRAPKPKPLAIEIRKTDLLRHFPRAKGRFFSPGETILKEGEEAGSCFYLHTGKIAIHKKGRDRTTFDLGTLESGSFFGEMAMLSGERRSATCTATTRVEAIEITRGEFELVTRSGNPQAARLALHFAVELANRSSKLLKLLGKQDAEKSKGRSKKAAPHIVDVPQILHKVYSLWAV